MLKADETSGNVLFEEKQKFPNWLILMIMGILLFSIVINLLVGYLNQTERTEMWIGLGIAVPIEIGAIILFQKVRLEKIVTSNGLYYRWKPWQGKFRVIEKESIKKFEVRKSPPLHYGVGWFPGYGKVHNASSGEGIQMYLVNGNKIYLSTFDISFFRKALENLISANPKPRFGEF